MIQGLNHITLAVQSIEISFLFYKNVMQFKPLVKWHAGAYFILPDQTWFCLNVDRTRIPNPCYTHIAFSVAQSEFEMVKARLIQSGVTAFQVNQSEGDSFYFLDPDGHKLEIHVGNDQTRLQHKKENLGKWENVQFFEDELNV